ncbi:MAG TPA: energy transducer TonB [Opitutaceae bacterium]|nr:energy transducer TonB [Opitutaceae bacterium]
MKRALLLAGVLLAAGRPSVRAQSVLLIQDEDGRLAPVVEVHGVDAYVAAGGRVTPGRAGRFQLRSAPVYAGSAWIEHFDMRTSGESVDGGHAFNVRLRLEGTLTASAAAEKPFLVFELLDERQRPKELGVVGLPPLPEDAPVPFAVFLPVGEEPREHRYRLHVFSGPREFRLLRKGQVDPSGLTVAADSAAADRNPAPYVLVPPRYPAALQKSGPAGQATIRCRIGADGIVSSAAVVRADRPEFGAAAADAVSQWLFLPAVRGRRYAPAQVDIPVVFTAPRRPGN